MRIDISTLGDPSVGISRDHISVDWKSYGDHHFDREYVRGTLHAAFREIMDEAVDVRFEDECVECRSRTCLGTCTDVVGEGDAHDLE